MRRIAVQIERAFDLWSGLCHNILQGSPRHLDCRATFVIPLADHHFGPTPPLRKAQHHDFGNRLSGSYSAP